MQETEPASTRSGFRLRFGKFCSTNLCSTNLLCIFFSVVIGLGCSAFALSSYGSGGVSELLESVFVPDAALLAHGRECGHGVCGGDWWDSFDRAGWSKCKQGCAMTGMCRV